jgi:hypothetical protein
MVHVFVDEPDGEQTVLDAPGPGADLAGPESWRTTVWGSPAVRALGARFFPVLDGNNVTVDPEDVPAFLEECALLRANLAAFAPDGDVERVGHRLGNIERASRRALEVGGGVLVW